MASLPTTIAAWNAPGRRVPEPADPYPSLVISIDPGLETPYAHHLSAGVERELPGSIALATDVIFVRGFKQLSTLDYNPLVAVLGPNRRPADVNGVPGTSASVLQYTSFGETWYRGVTVSASRRFVDRHQFMISYTLSKAEDNGTDFQSEFIAQDSGRGRNPDDVNGLPLGFDPDSEKGPSVQDQRHRFVASGIYILPKALEFSTIVTIGSGRPYNILAGVDLNADGDGGATDRARGTLSDITTSVQRNAGTLPDAGDRRSQAGAPISDRAHDHRRDLRGVQSLQPLEFHGGQQRVRHGLVSGKPGADVRSVHAGRAAAARCSWR